MANNTWKQSFTIILIGVKFLGIYWELWMETKSIGDDDSVFIEEVKAKYRKKFGSRSFYIKPIYPSTSYLVQ
jgi:hypothetical protein